MCRCRPFSCTNKPLGHEHSVSKMWGHHERSGLVPEKSGQGRVLWQTLATLSVLVLSAGSTGRGAESV